MRYARTVNNHKEYQEEYGYHYISKDFQLRTFNGMDHMELATVFWQDYIFPDFTFEKIHEFANYLDAYAKSIWDENLILTVLECMQLRAVNEGLECTIFVLDSEGKEETQKLVFSKVECFSISKNIYHYLDRFTSRGKTLVLDVSRD